MCGVSPPYSAAIHRKKPAAPADRNSIRKEVTPKMLSNLYLRLRELMARAQEREEGQGMVEYALILVLIAVVVIVILTVVGKQVNNVFSNISNGLNQ
jgi:pilus assembly protein Flp/PilA